MINHLIMEVFRILVSFSALDEKHMESQVNKEWGFFAHLAAT
jgi:hypothetical protein